MALKNKIISVLCLLLFVTTTVEAKKRVLEWRVESSLKKMERPPAYAGEATPFPYKKRPVQAIRSQKKFIPQALTSSQKVALEAADVLSRIRRILNNKDIFNADMSDLTIEAIIQVDGVRSVLIKNKWYNEQGIMDVPIVAKENLMSLVDLLGTLDESLAAVVEDQVNEKLEMVHNLSLRITAINEKNVQFNDEQGKVHVINFKPKSF